MKYSVFRDHETFRTSGEPHFGHFWEVQGMPAVWGTVSPHFGQTQLPAGPTRFPCPATGPVPKGPVPSLPGIYDTSYQTLYADSLCRAYINTCAAFNTIVVCLCFAVFNANGVHRTYAFAASAAIAFGCVYPDCQRVIPFLRIDGHPWLLAYAHYYHKLIMGICQ